MSKLELEKTEPRLHGKNKNYHFFNSNNRNSNFEHSAISIVDKSAMNDASQHEILNKEDY